MPSSLVIGTRASLLALWQANHVKELLQKKFQINAVLKPMTTKGDRVLDQPLVDVGGKGLFLKEIEDELLAGTIDLAVNSIKDVPYEVPQGLTHVAILKRENPFDVFVSHKFKSIDQMPAGSVVGTSSLRRLEQLQRQYPSFKFKSLRGNVDTRLKRLDQDEYDAIVLAAAGLLRLGLGDRIRHELNIVPGAGQGALGLECRENRSELVSLLSQLNDFETARAVHLERYFLKKVQGSCHSAVGCYARSDGTPNGFVMDCLMPAPLADGSFTRQIKGLWATAESQVDKCLT